MNIYIVEGWGLYPDDGWWIVAIYADEAAALAHAQRATEWLAEKNKAYRHGPEAEAWREAWSDNPHDPEGSDPGTYWKVTGPWTVVGGM